MEINRKSRVMNARREIEDVIKLLESRGEIEAVVIVENLLKIVDTLVEEIDFLEREIIRMGKG